ncbi:MAG: RNA polymerase sigma factor [Pseudomarimonas sp.]
MTSDLLRTQLQQDFVAAQAGDKAAYGRLMARTQGVVTGIALAHTRDLALSQDIAQETFLRGWMRLSDIHSAESFLPWLREVARNQALDQLRARRYREVTLGDDPQGLADRASVTATPEQHVLDIELSDWLRDAIEHVPADSREVLMLYYMEGKRSQQVAALLDMSDASVRKRLQRARDHLSQQFLQAFDGALTRVAPGAGVASAVLAAISGTGSTLVKAAATSGVAKAGGSLLGGAGATLAGLMAAVAAVFFGVYLEIRSILAPMRSPARRRAVIVNGVVYAALMAGYVLALGWVKAQGWSGYQILAMAVAVAALIVMLALHRIWQSKRDAAERG